jgi:hypothetical protein
MLPVQYNELGTGVLISRSLCYNKIDHSPSSDRAVETTITMKSKHHHPVEQQYFYFACIINHNHSGTQTAID